MHAFGLVNGDMENIDQPNGVHTWTKEEVEGRGFILA
jgi:hypothetical protein